MTPLLFLLGVALFASGVFCGALATSTTVLVALRRLMEEE